MAAILIGNWWALALRGVVAIVFAIIAFFWPGITATALILLFGVYALIDGIFALVVGLRAARRHGRSGALLVEGILNILIAVVVLYLAGDGAGGAHLPDRAVGARHRGGADRRGARAHSPQRRVAAGGERPLVDPPGGRPVRRTRR